MKAGVDVYASPGAWAASGVELGHRGKMIRANTTRAIGSWRARPFNTEHDADGSLGYLIAGPSGDRVLFAIDTASIPPCLDAVEIFALECNWSRAKIAEAANAGTHPAQIKRVVNYHMSIERVVKYLKRCDLSACREIHLLHMSSRHADSAVMIDTVQRATGKPTYAAPRRRDADR